MTPFADFVCDDPECGRVALVELPSESFPCDEDQRRCDGEMRRRWTAPALGAGSSGEPARPSR